MNIRETLVNRDDIDYKVHPIGGRIYLLPVEITLLLYNGNDINFYVSERRDLTPLVLGVMAMNIVSAKSLSKAYPKSLIDPVLWRPEYVNICKKLVFKTENGIEASLKTLEPSNFIHLRVSNTLAKQPLLRVFFEKSIDNSTIHCSTHIN